MLGKYLPHFLIALFVLAVLAEEEEVETKAAEEKPIKSLSNGFGEEIEWVAWPQAVSVAMDLNKPVFLLIHKTWCGACNLLKESFKTSSKRKELIELSKQFVMTNTEDDDEPEEDLYAPDGRYIPRLFFLDKSGKPLPVDNKKNYAKNAHYFPQLQDVIKAMKQALKEYAEPSGETEADAEEKKVEETIEPTKSEEKKSTKKEAVDPEETADKKSTKKEKTEKEKEAGKKTKTEKQPTEKKKKEADKKTKETKSNKDEEVAEEAPAKQDKKKEKKSVGNKEEEAPSGCPHAAAAKARAAEKQKKDKAAKTGEDDSTSTPPKAKETKKETKQTKKSEL